MNHFPVPLQAKKQYGQHFLVQPATIRRIVDAALASGAERLLEIGPGPGVLTEPLLQDGRPLWTVELDPEACALLQERFGPLPHYHLLPGDAVQVPLPPGPPWAIVGNLPYNAATAILTRLLLQDIPWERMVLMFQLEVGEKLLGRPGQKAYGPLSVLAQLSARCTRLLKLGPGSFSPPPKVDSAVLLFEQHPDALPQEKRAPLLDLLHRSFAHRRKTLANNWQGWRSPERIAAALRDQGLQAAVRAEAVPPEAWPGLLEALEGP